MQVSSRLSIDFTPFSDSGVIENDTIHFASLSRDRQLALALWTDSVNMLQAVVELSSMDHTFLLQESVGVAASRCFKFLATQRVTLTRSDELHLFKHMAESIQVNTAKVFVLFEEIVGGRNLELPIRFSRFFTQLSHNNSSFDSQLLHECRLAKSTYEQMLTVLISHIATLACNVQLGYETSHRLDRFASTTTIISCMGQLSIIKHLLKRFVFNLVPPPTHAG